MMKFAERRVAGWKNRNNQMVVVAERLELRQHRGFTLMADERKWLADFYSLRNLYNK